MKASMFKILFSLMAITALMLTSCEGPEGPEGPQGPAGEDGKSAAIDCADCHNNSSLLKAKLMQYENSAHYMGSSYSFAGARDACAACHANEGFNDWAATSFGEVSAPDYPTPVACRTCHEIHVTNTIEDYKLVNAGAFNLMGDMTNNDEVDMGKGNQCAKCHQSRERNYGFEVGGSSLVNISSSHWGPHYGTQTNVMLGKGGFEMGSGYPTGDHIHNTASQDGCVSCHANTGDHTFAATLVSCESCHSGIESFDLGGFQTDFAAKLKQLEDLLVADGLLEMDEDGHGSPINGQEVEQNKAGALFNYFILVNDGSHGVHNPRYAEALLDNSIAVFE